MQVHRKKHIWTLIIAVPLAVLFLIPLVWMLSTSFKTDIEAIAGNFSLIPHKFTIKNYVLNLMGGELDVPILRWIINSLSVGTAGMLLVLLIDALAAYGLTRLDVPFRKTLISIFIGSLMIPSVLTFLPLYMQFNAFGLIDTYGALILPYTSSAFGVFLLMQFYRSYPKEIEEAARIDGANKWQIFSRIIIPSSLAILVTLGIFTFMFIYNDFVWPLYATTSPEMRTITAGVAIMAFGSFVGSYAKLMSLACIATIPMLIIFLIGQKSFVKAITQSGVK
jgi:multiple sugar transport system permease protein